MKKIIIGLSGGMDSATLLGILLEQGYEVHCCSFLYGSKHNKYELAKACKIVEFYQQKKETVFHYSYDLQQLFLQTKSNLMQSGGEIPEGHYASENMRVTVVPGRNLIFASIMASLAESKNIPEIALGVHAGDHHIYPDCRPFFIEALHQTIHTSTEGKVSICTPLLHDNKTMILKIGVLLKVPYHLTRTCYKDQELSCGKCGSCTERLEAFANINQKDPIEYAK